MAKRGRPKKGTWVSAKTIAEELGTSQKYIRGLRQTILKQGIHWQNISPKGRRPSYRFDHATVLRAISEYWEAK